MKKGLAPHTSKIFEAVTKLDCIKPYVLVGGTALSLQIETRLSEDLDFMAWLSSKSDKREVDWPKIKRELESVGKVEKVDILDLNHVEFVVEGVKISFYISPNRSPIQHSVTYKNNLRLADLTAIGAMKMEVLLRRSKFRDYYDIYSLIQNGVSFQSMIELALKYSGHKLKSKNLIAILTNSVRFTKDSSFYLLEPKFDVSPKEIEEAIRHQITTAD